jgi:hypothetical protein
MPPMTHGPSVGDQTDVSRASFQLSNGGQICRSQNSNECIFSIWERMLGSWAFHVYIIHMN